MSAFIKKNIPQKMHYVVCTSTKAKLDDLRGIFRSTATTRPYCKQKREQYETNIADNLYIISIW